MIVVEFTLIFPAVWKLVVTWIILNYSDHVLRKQTHSSDKPIYWINAGKKHLFVEGITKNMNTLWEQNEDFVKRDNIEGNWKNFRSELLTPKQKFISTYFCKHLTL
jgi:hypothetical protein